MTNNNIITKLGEFSKEKFTALLLIRSAALSALRETLKAEGYLEVTTASLVNIAGSCENPLASFTLNYYGREAHLSQSSQLQLEAIVLRLKKSVFTVNTSFREEHYNDQEAQGRRLSEFTLVEAEQPYPGLSPEQALEQIMATEERVIKQVVGQVLRQHREEIILLGGKVEALENIQQKPFARLSYDQAIMILNQQGGAYQWGDDLGIQEERKILAQYHDYPTFLIHHPTKIKFFNMKRSKDGKYAYSIDLLMSPLGETSGGAVREQDGQKISEYLLKSKIAQYLLSRGTDPLKEFEEYFNLFKEEEPLLRGGFGIGFERLIACLINSSDILATIAYHTMQPNMPTSASENIQDSHFEY